MSLHPIIALDHIIDEYRDHLLTEFHAREDGNRPRVADRHAGNLACGRRGCLLPVAPDGAPWRPLDAYAAGVGSPLELKFLRLFEQHGFSPAKQVPISVLEGSSPIWKHFYGKKETRLLRQLSALFPSGCHGGGETPIGKEGVGVCGCVCGC